MTLITTEKIDLTTKAGREAFRQELRQRLDGLGSDSALDLHLTPCIDPRFGAIMREESVDGLDVPAEISYQEYVEARDSVISEEDFDYMLAHRDEHLVSCMYCIRELYEDLVLWDKMMHIIILNPGETLRDSLARSVISPQELMKAEHTADQLVLMPCTRPELWEIFARNGISQTEIRVACLDEMEDPLLPDSKAFSERIARVRSLIMMEILREVKECQRCSTLKEIEDKLSENDVSASIPTTTSAKETPVPP